MSELHAKLHIDEILTRRRIIVTCGTGGVGKTTLSAAMALRAAVLGRKAVVITIDPAKRLVTSLGLSQLGDEPTDLTDRVREARERAQSLGLPAPDELPGRFAALMPDTMKTFENLFRELAGSPERGDRIVKNPIFQILMREFSGANEYMALQRLHELAQTGDFDCIILDTPPSRNTLAFLEAPQLLARLFEERLIRWLVLPANKIVSAGMKTALGLLEKLTGSGFMTQLLDLATALFEIQEPFMRKLKKVTALLESDQVGFLLVAGANPDAAPEIGHFVKAIQSHRFHFDGVAINRTLGYLRVSEDEWTQARAKAQSGNPGLRESLQVIEALQKREAAATEALLRAVPASTPFAKLPELARDVHSVEDLFHVAMALGPLRPRN